MGEQVRCLNEALVCATGVGWFQALAKALVCGTKAGLRRQPEIFTILKNGYYIGFEK